MNTELSTGDQREIPIYPLEGSWPLSFAQERIWFLQQMYPTTTGYHLSIALHLQGNLHVEELEESFHVVIRRHAILRSIFPERDGVPVQIVRPAIDFSLEIIDLPSSTPEQLTGHLITAIARPFHFASGPLFRAELFRLTSQEHVLLITLHHLISDGWSNGILIHEIGQCYTALVREEPITLQPLSVQFADFALREREQFQDKAQQTAQQYWQKQLADAPDVLTFPFDYPRPETQTFAAIACNLPISDALWPTIQTLCQQERVTFAMLLLTTLNILLWRYTGQTDLCIGLPAFNRQLRGAEQVIGLFTNTLVIRTSLTPETTFSALLAQVRTTTLAAYTHQSYPFEKLVDALQLKRDTSHSPLFQVMLVIGAREEMHIEWPGLTVTPFPLPKKETQFDLTLEAFQQLDGWHLSLQARADLCEPATLSNIGAHLLTLLEHGVAQPHTQIDRLSLLSSAERDRLLADWNATNHTFSPPFTLHRLFEEQVTRTPDAVALIAENEMLSYLQLNRAANRLAWALQSKGVKPGTLVGIAVPRSLDLVVGLLGILKAGGAYVPLDTSYPQERLAFMLEDAQISVLITHQLFFNSFPEMRIPTMMLDRDGADLIQMSPENLGNMVHPEDLAYVIYTSGSTGQPKGCMNQHGAICNRLRWMQMQYSLDTTDRVFQKTPYSFDVSVWEFFWPLINGAALVLARPEGHKDAAYLATVIREQAITTLHFVPSMLQVFLAEPGVEACVSLRRVICSGEALPATLQQRFFERCHATLHNLYGPTEAAVDVTYWDCLRGDTRSFVPIGKAVANTQIYILDQDLQLVPPGVPGELYVGGVQVGRGYLRRPDLTASRFLPDPFSQQPGARLYRTGDLARYRADGQLEYLGRTDHQIKLRGLRIELGEIEARLNSHPVISSCVVLPLRGETGDLRLVAYLTVHTGHTLTLAEIQAFLHTTLPEYMIPGAFVVLDALPLAPNGKLDRKALPDPNSVSLRPQQQVLAPDTDVERTLLEIWQEVLGHRELGIQDNFFEVGGHSLLVTQVRWLIRQRLSVELPVLDLFRFTTIQALGRHIHHLTSDQGSVPQTKTEPISPALTQQATSRAELQRQALKRKRLERKES